MPKRGLDVCSCEVFRFYKLVTIKSLIEPLSMIVPRRSESYQEDIYPTTAGNQPSMTADEWLRGLDKGPVMMSLKPGSTQDSYAELNSYETHRSRSRPSLPQLIQEQPNAKEENKPNASHSTAQLPFTDENSSSPSNVSNRQLDVTQCSPPKTENELRQVFYKQQDEIRRLKELVNQKDVRIKQLELEIKNVRNLKTTWEWLAWYIATSKALPFSLTFTRTHLTALMSIHCTKTHSQASFPFRRFVYASHCFSFVHINTFFSGSFLYFGTIQKMFVILLEFVFLILKMSIFNEHVFVLYRGI